MSRTINIVVTNRSGSTLYFRADKSQQGPACTANKSSVTSGQTITVTAVNKGKVNGGNKGTFTLSNNPNFIGDLTYVVFYTHPQLKGTTYIQLQRSGTNPKGPPNTNVNAVGTYYQVYTGDPIDATANVYKGVSVPGSGGFAVPLQPKPYDVQNNCQDFANSMFGPYMRAGSLIVEKYKQTVTPYLPADFSGGQMNAIVSTLLDCWNTRRGPDAPILDFLKDYIAPPAGQNQPLMQLWVPTLVYQNNTSPAQYQISGYQNFALASYSANKTAWTQDGVRTFLQLMAGGAHMVAVSAVRDFESQGIAYNSRDLYSAFRKANLSQRGDPVNSHYANVIKIGGKDVWGNFTGQYYLDINQDAAPLGCGLILALLFGRTVNNTTGGTYTPGQYNTFMQLEGWPATGTGDTWHNADFNAYQQSLWNTATYGACPYSEKRATTVFLAPTGWQPAIYQTTRMMPYVGALADGKYPNGKPQEWLNAALVTLPASAPELPRKYYQDPK